MAYRANPFLERMSERSTSDQDFVRLFSPKILERLGEGAFGGGVHFFRSSPGAGKTTLLRAFTPSALHGFWSARRSSELAESFTKLKARELVDEERGPQLLGVLLSCASGYADLPPGAELSESGLFRALLDSRVVLRTLRSVASLLKLDDLQDLAMVHIELPSEASNLSGIPRLEHAGALLQWAESQEQRVYAQLDSLDTQSPRGMPAHVRFESIVWLQSVTFTFRGQVVAPKRLLMIDDVHRLQPAQRSTLIDELAILRPTIPVWLAERSIALGETLISQGIRTGRDVSEYVLEEMWGGARGTGQFQAFAISVLDRRMNLQDVVATSSFSPCIRNEYTSDEIRPQTQKGIDSFNAEMRRHESSARYRDWIARAKGQANIQSQESLLDLFVTRILIARDENRRQMDLDLTLSAATLDERDSSQLRGAGEIFMHEELGVPYYYGMERLCALATNNIDELLYLASELFVALQAKHVLRKSVTLSAAEQDKALCAAAKRKRDFIPKSHTAGLRAQRLLDSVGAFCRERTFQATAPYAPGVTGVRLSQSELRKFENSPGQTAALRAVLSECVAENLLVERSSASSTSREGGTVFYLSRTLCAYYGLPVQYGGWQDVTILELLDWSENGPARRRRLEIH